MTVDTAKDAYSLIHSGLGAWIEGAIAEGFESEPIGRLTSDSHWADELIAMADRMARLETRIEHLKEPE